MVIIHVNVINKNLNEMRHIDIKTGKQLTCNKTHQCKPDSEHLQLRGHLCKPDSEHLQLRGSRGSFSSFWKWQLS